MNVLTANIPDVSTPYSWHSPMYTFTERRKYSVNSRKYWNPTACNALKRREPDNASVSSIIPGSGKKSIRRRRYMPEEQKHCTQCNRPIETASTFKLCEKCRLYHRNYYNRMRDRGRSNKACVRCKKPMENYRVGTRLCQACMDAEVVYNRGNRHIRIQRGKCTTCASPIAPGNKTKCMPCIEKQREANYRFNAKRKQIQQETGCCQRCKQPREETRQNRRFCQTCHNQGMHKIKTYQQRKAEKSLCSTCPKPKDREDRKQCAECRDKEHQRFLNRAKRKKAND